MFRRDLPAINTVWNKIFIGMISMTAKVVWTGNIGHVSVYITSRPSDRNISHFHWIPPRMMTQSPREPSGMSRMTFMHLSIVPAQLLAVVHVLGRWVGLEHMLAYKQPLKSQPAIALRILLNSKEIHKQTLKHSSLPANFSIEWTECNWTFEYVPVTVPWRMFIIFPSKNHIFRYIRIQIKRNQRNYQSKKEKPVIGNSKILQTKKSSPNSWNSIIIKNSYLYSDYPKTWHVHITPILGI